MLLSTNTTRNSVNLSIIAHSIGRVTMFKRIQLWPTTCSYVWRSLIDYQPSFILGAPSSFKVAAIFSANRNLGRESEFGAKDKSLEKVTHTFVAAIRLMEYHRPVLSSILRSFQWSFEQPQWRRMCVLYYVDRSVTQDEIMNLLRDLARKEHFCWSI